MVIEKTKDVSINGYNFRIGLVNALVGNWLILQYESGKLTEEATFAKAQAHAFEVCSVLKDMPDGNIVPLKIFAKPDRWLVPDLADDIDTIKQLWEEFIAFNLDPFFLRWKAKAAAAAAAAAAATPATNQ